MSILDSEYKIKREICMLIISAFIFLFSIINKFDNMFKIILVIGLFILLRYFGMFSYKINAIKYILNILSFITCFYMCYLNPTWYTFILFIVTITGIDKIKKNIQIVLILLSPLVSYITFCITEIVKTDLKYILLGAVLLFFISIIYITLETIISNYYYTNNKLLEVLKDNAITELQEKNLNRELAIKNYLADRNARLEEREKISRDIHNVVGHTITSAIMALDASQVLIDVSKDEAVKKIEIANDRMHDSLESIRQAVRVMDDTNKYININDLKEMLSRSINEFVIDTEIKIRHNISKSEDNIEIPTEHAQFLCGALLELLTNGVKHGKANAFIVIFVYDSTHIKLSVEDNGYVQDFNEELFLEKGFGLKKIKKYVDECGGKISIHNSDGFSVDVQLPIL